MRRISAAIAVAAVVALAGCSSGSDDDVSSVSFEMPGQVPSDVSFIDAPPTAPPAPSFELELLDGSAFDVTEHWAERPVVLVFFESWCELCADQQADITALSKEYQDAVLFVGIGNESSAEDAAEYMREHDITYPVALDPDGQIFRRYGVDEPPLVALVARGGQLVRGWPGGTDKLGDQLREFVVQ